MSRSITPPCWQWGLGAAGPTHRAQWGPAKHRHAPPPPPPPAATSRGPAVRDGVQRWQDGGQRCRSPLSLPRLRSLLVRLRHHLLQGEKVGVSPTAGTPPSCWQPPNPHLPVPRLNGFDEHHPPRWALRRLRLQHWGTERLSAPSAPTQGAGGCKATPGRGTAIQSAPPWGVCPNPHPSPLT